MFDANLTNCDVEPIRIPGKVQSYGFMVSVDNSHKINFCSENISTFLHTTAQELLSAQIGRLEGLLSEHTIQGYLGTLLHLFDAQANKLAETHSTILINSSPYSLLITKSADLYLLEFEPEIIAENADNPPIIATALSDMLSEKDLSRLLTDSVIQIKKIIGYDRVMIYKFHEDGHGEVMAEARKDGLGSWLGLHYPASDIPKQARELYKINLTRQIADVNSEPSAIVGLNEATSLDMTHIAMRAVSPIHIQYLKNMGVASSFSISILYHGELWGLIACHSYQTRFINYRARNSAKLIGQVFSSALSYHQLQADQDRANRNKASIDTIAVNLLAVDNIPEALFKTGILLDAVEASGALLFFDRKLYTTGKVPDEKFCLDLIDSITGHTYDQYFETNCLSKSFPAAAHYKELASGILVCVLSNELKEVLIWFRPEVLTTMKWAGDPAKDVTVGVDGPKTLHPRVSFASFTEDISLCSTSWKKEEIRAAILVREKIVAAVSRKANELRLLNSRLKEAYDELDAFSYTLSHDLKNPLSAIKSYSQLLERNKNIDEGGKKMVSRIGATADKMHFMIEDILNYSRAGQQRVAYEKINMKSLIQEIINELSSSNHGAEISIQSCEDIYGDRTMIMQVFSNLIGNALKYSSKAVQPKIEINSVGEGTDVQYTITDNGIGIHPEEQHKIFELFTRSEGSKDFEGTGVGLSIVKKIVERHQGKIWVESDGASGSCFHVSFLKQDISANTK